MVGRRPRMERKLVELTSLTNDEVTALSNNGVNNAEALRYLTYEDIETILPDCNVVKRRKLYRAGRYADLGGTFDDTTTMKEITDFILEHDRPTRSTTAPTESDPMKLAPKFSVDSLDEFDGDATNFEDWHNKTCNTLNQTVMRKFLTAPPDPSKQNEVDRDKDLYYALKQTVERGTASHIVTNLEDGEQSGHVAWIKLKEWYQSTGVKDNLIDRYQQTAEKLELTPDITASTYINDWITCQRKLTDLESAYSIVEYKRRFIRGIKDPDYDVTKQLLTTTKDSKSIEELIVELRQKETELERDADKSMVAKSRRFQHHDQKGNDAGHIKKKARTGESNFNIPFIPKYIMQQLDSNGKKDILLWRKVWNKERREAKSDEMLYAKDDNSKSNAGQESHNKDSTNAGKKGNNKRSRRTKTSDSGTKKAESSDVKFSMLSDEEQADKTKTTSTAYDDSVHSVAKFQNDNGPGKSRRFSSIRRNNKSDSIIVLDSGTEATVAGGPGWTVLDYVGSRTETFGGAIPTMQTCSLPIANVITALTTKSGKTVLVGLGGAAYNSRADATEALLNTHDLRDNGITVNDIAKEHGGRQEIIIGGHIIPLQYSPRSDNVNGGPEGKIMTISCRRPTSKEQSTLEILWLSPYATGTSNIPENTNPSIRRDAPLQSDHQQMMLDNAAPVGVTAKDNVGDSSTVAKDAATPDIQQKQKVRWKEQLANPTDEVLEKTLQATTRFCEAPVEMETREIPRQHRKQRLLPLHPRRIKGRTDSDTFFSSVKSIRGLRCVQIFVCLLSDFIYIKCLRRESQSHSAYQDFIRDVGAPNCLLTDNSQTQTGSLWTTTNRKNATKQVNSVPHNQNQNTAERKIHDVKRRSMLTLLYSNAPLVFWCYCLHFVVDCLNYTARKKLDWRTPVEVLNGDTPDISMFRFKFWQPIWYYEQPAKWPRSKKLPGRWIGIAWDHGDDFTYKIWTTPNGDWTKGGELIRNVVMPRDIADKDVLPTVNFNVDSLTLEKVSKPKKKRGRRKRKRKGNGTTPPDSESTVGDETLLANSDGDDEIDTTVGHVALPKAVPASLNNISDDVYDAESDDESIVMGDFNPVEGGTVDMVNEVNDSLSPPADQVLSGGAAITDITNHRWKEGRLQLQVVWSTETTSWEEFRDLKEDIPSLAARYIVDHNVSRSRFGRDRNLQWAKKTLRDVERSVRRIARLYDSYLDGNNIKLVRRIVRRKKKKSKGKSVVQFKYGVKVPRTVQEALSMDKENSNTLWADAIQKEVQSLTDLECFEFKPRDHKPDNSYQQTRLHMVFDVKQDLRHKARLVAGGHLVDSLDNPVYSSTVKGISVRLIHVIAHKAGLKQLMGDVGNAYVNAYTNEKVWARAGPEFGELQGKVIIIKKALYGLATSGERWHKHFADTLRSLGFTPTRYDRDVWIRKFKDGKSYEYICTHVDDFCITSKDPETVMNEIKKVYLVKSCGPLDYYLGNDYKVDKRGRLCIGCKTFLTEATKRVERIFGALKKAKTPMTPGDHPEQDDSPTLNDDDHRKYQMLIGILVWLVTIGRFDVAYATSSLSRFVACPRNGHLQRVLRVFEYLKGRQNLRIIVDSRDPVIQDEGGAMDIDYTETLADQYPWAQEEVDVNVPIPLIDEISLTCFVDSDHSHDTVTRRSITGMVIFLGRTPVFYMSKRQGAIETSTYSSEFCAMKMAVEEVIAMRYMLRCLGVKVEHATPILGDNKGVIQNSTIPDSLLKKKHVAIAYHKTREAAASGAVHPLKTKGDWNFSDILTKPTTEKTFTRHVNGMSRG